MTPRDLHFQHALAASPKEVFAALTHNEHLTRWFCEFADVDLANGEYHFWGRFTPGNPNRESAIQSVVALEQDRLLRITWPLRGVESTVTFRLAAVPNGTRLGVWHAGLQGAERGSSLDFSMSDVWFLMLENLRRYLDGRSAMRCDFSTFDDIKPIDLQTEIAGPSAQAWEALLRPNQLNTWIASAASVDARVGGEWNMGWGDEGAFKILELEPGKRLSLEWLAGDAPTIVTWTLEEVEGGARTRLTLTHSGFASDYIPRGERAGWSAFICWITSFVEYGSAWLPPTRALAPQDAMMYPHGVMAQQESIVTEEEWDR